MLGSESTILKSTNQYHLRATPPYIMGTEYPRETYKRYLLVLLLFAVLLNFILVNCDRRAISFVSSRQDYRDEVLFVTAKSSRRCLPFPFQAFWHLGDTGLPAFKMVVHEQYDRLQRSGLLDVASVSASYVGPEASGMPDFNDSRITTEYVGPASLHEFSTLRKLQTYCALTPDGRALYFHTKGQQTK
jgi:hypothetical protein